MNKNRRICGCSFRVRVSFFLLTWLLGVLGCGSGGMALCLENGECKTALDVVEVSGEIPIDPNASFWNQVTLPPVTVELDPQMITNPKWPDPSVKTVRIKVARNGTEIAIFLEWGDSSMETEIEVSAIHTDQAAVMFPLNPEAELPPITMGGENHPVNIWQWKAAWQPSLKVKKKYGLNNAGVALAANPRRSPVEDLNAEGFSTLTTQDEQDVFGGGSWEKETWRVVFKRALISPDNADVQFRSSVPMAVAVWNGGNGERNGQKGLAGWILLRFA